MADIDHEKSITGGNYCGGCGQDWPCQHELLRSENERLHAALMAIRSITIAADHASQRVDHPVSAYRPAIRNIREAAEEVLDTR
jgi:hypothetical protein